jgi:transketolase
MRNTVANKIIEKAKIDPSVYLITGDAGLGVWDSFKVEYPSQYINPGVNEALCVGMAAGMALRGHRVIYYNIAPFVIMRPYEQVRNDICYQELPVILVGTGSGLTYAPAGMTHYAIEDIALARTMPNLDVFSPADPVEAALCFEYAYKSDKPSYIRVPKAGEPKLHKTEEFDISEPQIMRDGKDLLIISHSAMVEECLSAANLLDECGISAQVVSMPMITSKSPKIDELLTFDGKIFVAEEHYAVGGLGTLLAEKTDRKVHKIALPGEFIHAIGNRDFMRCHYGIDAASIAKKIKDTQWVKC